MKNTRLILALFLIHFYIRYNQKVLNKLKRSSNINEIENEDKPQQQDRHISKLKEIVNKNRERKIK